MTKLNTDIVVIKKPYQKGHKANKGSFKKGCVSWSKGKRMKEMIKNYVNPREGKEVTVETRKKMSLAKLGKTSNALGKKWKLEERAWNWQGGVSSFNKVQRIKFRNTIQKLVLERDNYTCQMCGVRGVVLQVDHIQSWKDYVELRFDINNCRTLCQKCHYKITFGKEMPEDIKTWGHNFKQIEGIMLNV